MKIGGKLVFFLLIFASMCAPGGTEPELPEEGGGFDNVNPDAAAFAEERGISLEEAHEVLGRQDNVGRLQAELLAEEAERFAGLWIEYEPVYKVVVAFVGEADASRLRPYLQSYPDLTDYIEIRTAQYSLAELETAQRQAFDIVSRLETMSIAGGVDIMQNRVVLTVGNPGLFLQAVNEAGLELPPMVVVEPIDPENIPASNAGGLDLFTSPTGQTIFFPRQAPAVAGMDALLEGILRLDDHGCLRVIGENGSIREAPVVIWHYDDSLAFENEDILVLNGDGEPVGKVGEPARMGGGESTAIEEPELPNDCPGPYWILGSVEPLTEQRSPDINTQD